VGRGKDIRQEAGERGVRKTKVKTGPRLEAAMAFLLIVVWSRTKMLPDVYNEKHGRVD
jgi:hypothetical protein